MAKKNKRNREKYPALRPNLNLKSRYEEISDIATYFDKLPEEAKKFMHSFVEEYVNAKFDHGGKKIYKKKSEKRSIYNRNNARNRDILTKANAMGQSVSIDDKDIRKRLVKNSDEDYIILKIDIEKELKEKKLRVKKLKKVDSSSND
jgi:hypothetical protein